MPEKADIGGFETQRAVTDYGGRKWLVWFATEIPVPEGPYIFRGGAGLIVRATDAGGDYDFLLNGVKKGISIKCWEKTDQSIFLSRSLQVNF